MPGREGAGVFLKRSAIIVQVAWLLWGLLLIQPAIAQEKVATEATVSERAFPFKALPIELWVERGEGKLPITRVPELRRGDVIRLRPIMDAPEMTSQNADEQSRLRDWSIGWFLTTPEGSLVFDSTREGKTDRGRIDLERGESEIAIEVQHDRQQFPIFFLVRTRTLESWEEIRRTRQTKASNFVDHFGKYSEVVGDYENLQAFLKSLQRENPQAEELEDRLNDGFHQLGFTVDSKMRYSDPKVVATLLSELETSLGSQSKTFKAEAAGKLLSQMIGDSDLGLIGAAVSIGGVLYRATDYSESYHWSSARLKESGEGRYWAMSAERIRHGEDEKAPDGGTRPNVRSILVLTPMPTQPVKAPLIGWRADGPNRLIPASTDQPTEVRVTTDTLTFPTHPGMVEAPLGPNARVWDSQHGDDSPLSVTIRSGGSLEVKGLQALWKDGAVEADVRVSGRWGFDELSLANLHVLRSAESLKLTHAPYLLSQGQKYRLALQSEFPVAIGQARFAGRPIQVEGTHLQIEPGRGSVGPAKLELYAGDKPDAGNLLLSQDFWVVAQSSFHVLLPQGGSRCELVSKDEELSRVLQDVKAVRVGKTLFHREGERLFSTAQPSGAEGETAELIFENEVRGSVDGVYLARPRPPREVDVQLYPRARRTQSKAYRIELDPARHLLASGQPYEFRLRSPQAWPGGTSLTLELRGPAEQVTRTEFGQELRVKGDLLFGDFTPRSSGDLVCRLSSPIPESRLPLEWSVASPWKVVDLPEIRRITMQNGVAILEGEQLDVTVARLFSSANDPTGSPLERRPDGTCQVALPDLQPEEFWLELTDLPGPEHRLRVVSEAFKQGGIKE